MNRRVFPIQFQGLKFEFFMTCMKNIFFVSYSYNLTNSLSEIANGLTFEAIFHELTTI